MPPTTARRRWTVVLAVQLAVALLAAGAHAGSAADAGELVWLGEAGGQTEGRWTTDPSVRPWRDSDGNPPPTWTASRWSWTSGRSTATW
jgi:hypothetical protein